MLGLPVLRRSIFSSALVTLLTFIAGVVLARGLGPELRGVWAAVALMGSLVATTASLGLGDSYLYHKRRHYSDCDMWSVLFLMVAAIVLSCLLLLVLLYMHRYEAHVLNYGAYFLLLSVVNFFTSISRVEESLRIYNISTMIEASIITILLSLLYFSGALTIRYVLLAYACSALIKLLFIILKRGQIWTYGDSRKNINFLPFFCYGAKVHAIAVVGLLVANFDRLYLFFNTEFESLGNYTVAYGFSRIVGIVPVTIAGVVFANLAGTHHEKSKKIVPLLFSSLLWPLIFAALGIGILCAYLIPLLYGSEFQDAVVPTFILLLECVFSSTGWILAQHINAKGKPSLVLVRQILSLFPLLLIFVVDVSYSIEIVISVLMLVSSLARFFLGIFMYRKIFAPELSLVVPNYREARQFFQRLG